MWRAGAAAAVLAALAATGPAAGQSAPPGVPAAEAAPSTAATVALTGQVKTPRTWSLADLQSLPSITVEVPDAPAAGVRRTAMSGPALWPLLQEAGPVNEPGRATQHRHTLLAQGRDGYAVAVAFGELDPYLGGKQVLIAVTENGHPLAAPRLIVPGDAHGARSVRDLVLIEVR